MEFKKFIVVLSITTAILVFIVLGISYGWYAYSNAQTTIEGKTKKEVPTVIFAQTEYVFSRVTMPIYDEDRYNYASKNSFSITIGEELKNYKVAIEISLKDITMSQELKSNNYKYELLQDGLAISSGNFSTIGSANTLKLLPMNLILPNVYPQTYNYELYIWLSDDGSNQNNLMNKVFTAKINVNSAIRK